MPTPRSLVGVLVATEWLDNVPLDLAEVDEAGTARYVLVDPLSGEEQLGEPLSAVDAAWAARWYGGASHGRPAPASNLVARGTPPGPDAVATLRRGLAITVDYGHTRDTRPAGGTLTAFHGGRQVPPVPDGSRDLTAHVAIDAVRAAVRRSRVRPPGSRRSALRCPSWGSTAPGRRSTMPAPIRPGTCARWPRRLRRPSSLAPDGLGGHFWLLQPVVSR